MYKEFLIGSKLFFSDIDGFETSHRDVALIFDSLEDFEHSKDIQYNNIDFYYHTNYFIYIKNDKDLFLQELYDNIKLKKVDSSSIGIILSKDLCAYLNIEIKDIKKFKNLFNLLDNKYKYLQIIYNAYVDNKNMELTNDLLMFAYDLYKKYKSQSL